MKNKILALILAVCMVTGIVLAVPTYAAEDNATTKAVMFLTDLNIMEGDAYTEEYWDDSVVKRFEIARILCRLFDYEVSIGSARLFVDVSEEDRPYVETIVQNGLMSGYGDGEFGPNDFVTYEQILKIFVDVLGGKNYAEVQGGFPMGDYAKIGLTN